MDLAYEDSGTERRVHVGETVRVSLPENPTTGYRWECDMDAEALHQMHDSYTGDVMPRGAKGARLLEFVALRPGVVTLRLVKRRSWDQAMAGEFTVLLRVVDDELQPDP